MISKRPSLLPYLVMAACLALLPVRTWAESLLYRDQDGRILELQVSDQLQGSKREAVVNWITFISDSLRQVFGHWPRQRWLVKVETVSGNAGDPIPWAQVRRGETDTVEFYILANASEEELRQAWTGYHELAHLLLPYRGWGDAWFSEGLASYYQNLMQARAGVISDKQMWQKLYDGFQRGRRDTRFDGVPLDQVSDGLRQHGGFMRVYWSGAWYFLQADLKLRQSSGGRESLDSALERLNSCCDRQSLSVTNIVRRLDELNRTTLFSELYRDTVTSTRVPPFEPLFKQLGIDIDNDVVQLQAASEEAKLRRQITSTRAL